MRASGTALRFGPDKLDPQRGHSAVDEYAAALYVVNPHAGQSVNGMSLPLFLLPS
jgi:hypothetical protein